MSASTNLCTRDSVKTYLGLTGSAHDDLIDLLIPAASEFMENHCGVHFDATSYTRYYDGAGADRIVLPERPVTDFQGVWDDPDREFGDDTKLDADDYVLDSARGILALRNGTFAEGVRNVKVAYTSGYSTVPTDVAQACRMLVAAWFRRAREGADGLLSRTAAEVAQRFAVEALPDSVRRLLRHYRRGPSV